MSDNTKAKKLADEHWEWLERLLEYVYKSAFEHGYKHALEDIRARGGRASQKREPKPTASEGEPSREENYGRWRAIEIREPYLRVSQNDRGGEKKMGRWRKLRPRTGDLENDLERVKEFITHKVRLHKGEWYILEEDTK